MRALFVAALFLSAGIARAQLPAAVGHLDSNTLPIRVYINTEENREYAELILTAAESAWSAQVDGMGFDAPYTVNDDMVAEIGARYYLTTSEQYYGYAAPVADIDATARTDCATVVVISDLAPDWYLPSLVQHEFNHAVQESIDCVEADFAYEQITVAVTELLTPDDMFAVMLAGFQEEPHRALYHTDRYDNYYYHYGASLFSYFLEHAYGEANGHLLARIWSATPQDGGLDWSSGWPESTVPNDPDLLAAMETILAEDGVAFMDAFATFSEYRYFIGARDDGKHIPGAGDWGGAELAMDTRYNAIDLPLSFESPRFAPEELGVSYIGFDLFGLDDNQVLRLAFAGDAETLWRVSAIHDASRGAEVAEVELTDGAGTILVSGLGAETRVVLAVTNLGDGEYDSSADPSTSDFVYSASLLDCGAVEVGSMAPDAVDAGETAVVTVTGSGFPSDQTIDVQVSGDGVVVTSVVRRSDSKLDVHLDVAADAPVGGRDVAIALECGTAASAVLQVADGSGCAAVSVGWPAGLLFLALRRRKIAA